MRRSISLLEVKKESTQSVRLSQPGKPEAAVFDKLGRLRFNNQLFKKATKYRSKQSNIPDVFGFMVSLVVKVPITNMLHPDRVSKYELLG